MKQKKIPYWIIIVLTFVTQLTWSQEGLTLSGSIEKALLNNYGIILSHTDLDIAGLNNSWGTAGRYPSVAFDASSNNSMDLLDEESTHRLNAGVGMNWTLFDGFRIKLTKGKLEELEELAGGRLAVVIENTIEDVILNYYNVLLQEEKLHVLEKVMNLSSDRYDYELARKELGGTVTYNVLQAQNVYLTDKAYFMSQEVTVRNSVRDLNFLMGEDPAITWTFTDPFKADTSDYILGDLLTKMIENNRTLQNQYINLLLQQRETALQKSNLYPTLRMSAGLDNTYSTILNPDDDPVTATGISPYGNLSLSFDIYTGGTRKRAIQVARLNEEAAQVEIEQMIHSLTNLLFNIHDLFTVRKALLLVADENLTAAELNMKIADEKFRTGAINSFNYRDIQLIYLNAALGRLQAIYNLIDSHTTLARLTGGFVQENP